MENITALQTKKMQVVGRRKTAVARVRMIEGKGNIIVNSKSLQTYFAFPEWQTMIVAPLVSVGKLKAFDFSIKVQGGGLKGQVDAAQLGIARALAKYDEDFKKTLKTQGYLTRDARVKERKKPGLKRARRAPQWSKR